MRLSAILWLKVLVHAVMFCAVVLIVWDFYNGQLTANPIEELTRRTGKYTLVSLILTLSCSPTRFLFRFDRIIKIRRLFGLYSFFFATLHFLTFIGLDYAFDLDLILKNVAKKRYVIAGFSVYVMLTLLALTSFNYARRSLGNRWKYLHALIYPAGAIAVLHFAWQMKSDIQEPALYGAIILLLLMLRLPMVRNRLTGAGGSSNETSNQ